MSTGSVVNAAGVTATSASGATPGGPAGGDLGGTFPNPTVSKVTGTVTSYNGIPTVGNGVPAEYAWINSNNLSANITASTLYTVPAGGGGLYFITMYAVVTTADGASSTLPNAGVVWTDADASVAVTANNVTSTNTANAAGAYGQGSVVINAKAGSVIQYLTSNYASGTAGAMKYALHVRLEYLG